VSYERLAEHAARIEQLAVHESLKQQGWTDPGHGELRAPTGVDVQDGKEMVARTEQRFAGVAGMFTPFLALPDPAGFTPMLGDLGSAMSLLSIGPGGADPVTGTVVPANPALEGMTTVGRTVQDWRGAGAAAFEQQFVEPFRAITANQFALVATLNGAIEAERALWADCRRNVDDLAHQAIKALEIIDECGPVVRVCPLTVASSVCVVRAMLTTGGAPIALTVAGAAGPVDSGVPRDDPPEVEFDGQTAAAVVEQVRDGLNRLAALTNATERVVADALASSAATLAANRSRFVAPAPALARATAATVTGPSGLGEPVR
jgi:hypothetical protein